MLIPEAALLATVQDGFAALRENPATLGDIFEMQPPEVISEVQQYLAGPLSPIKITLGFPQGEVSTPTIGLTLAPQEEADQWVGEGLEVASIGIGGDRTQRQDIVETTFQSTWRFTVYSANNNLTMYLAYIVKYILLAQRDFFQEELGLREQRLSMSDFEPVPEYIPNLVYIRAVGLSTKHQDRVTASVPADPITSVRAGSKNDI